MKRKISGSIQAKTFLSMLALLVVCCILIYGMVMIFLPRNYHTELEGQVTSDFYDLMAVLERNGWGGQFGQFDGIFHEEQRFGESQR